MHQAKANCLFSKPYYLKSSKLGTPKPIVNIGYVSMVMGTGGRKKPHETIKIPMFAMEAQNAIFFSDFPCKLRKTDMMVEKAMTKQRKRYVISLRMASP